MLKYVLIAIFVFGSLGLTQAQDDKTYRYQVDITKVNNDEIEVTLNPPKLKEKVLTFHLPKIIPGTYAIYDFGRFVKNFKAYNHRGKSLKVKRIDANTWEIKRAKKLEKVVYTVEDTWDTEKNNTIFEPAGTNIMDDKVFVFNNHGIFGYFDGHEKLPFELTIDRPVDFFGGTALERTGGDADTDVFKTESYNSLVDNPILYAEPDTAQFKVGYGDILIHVYSPTGKVTAKDLVKDIQPILESQTKYLGGVLPVDRYVFLIYLNKEGEMYQSGAAGALEHSFSSFYCLFEGEPSAIGQTVRDVAAHEFFHIVTPLLIHSEEIHNFDFINPKMSKHLWLYEGATEYAAQHVQVKQGLMPIEQFLAVMGEKMTQASFMKTDLPFTELSKTCLDENKSQYMNVYLKGALINMCLDLTLLTLSDGKYDLQKMMRDLSSHYGENKAFKDDELFDEIARITEFEELKPFFEKYVAGAEPLPIEKLVKKAGITYHEEGEVEELSPFGFDINMGVGFNMEKQLIEILPSGIDAFGKEVLGLKGKDLLYKWNGEKLTMQNVGSVMTTYAATASAGKEITVTVLRRIDGKYEKVELSGKLQKVTMTVPNAFTVDKNPTAEQLNIRKAWLGDYISESDEEQP